jgi:chromosome segregation ATPase
MSNRPRTPAQQIEADGIARNAERARRAGGFDAPITPQTELRAEVADLRSRLESVREQRDAAQRERNRLYDEVQALRIQVAYERNRADANDGLVKQIAGERDALGKQLLALTSDIRASIEAHGLEEEAGE